MQLAENLQMSLTEIRSLPSSEITLWIAYYEMKNKKEDTKQEDQSDVAKFKKMIGQG